MKLPALEEAKTWAENRAQLLAKSPRDKEAQYLLVLLHRLKSLERDMESQTATGRVIDI